MEDQIESGVSRLNSSPNPFKRRKFYRKREPDDGEAHSSNGISEPVSPPATSKALSVEELVSQHGDSLDLGSTKEQSGQLSAAEILRRRKSAQRKRMGVEFTTLCNTRADTTSLEPVNPPLEQNEPIPEIKTVVERFTPQTGQVADVNKHMMAYIDAELAKLGHGGSASAHPPNGETVRAFSPNGTLIDAGLNRQPAALGKLHEIDLGPDARLRNIARTEAAKRRLERGEAEAEEPLGKRQLRRNGRSYRGRKRRTSVDTRRDKLVEEVMRESRLEIYDEPEPDPTSNDDQAADDRIAEQFRREFLDAISSRRQRSSQAAKAARAAKNRGTKVDDRPKGPKLGGSRSARAAMRELQAKEAKERKR